MSVSGNQKSIVKSWFEDYVLNELTVVQKERILAVFGGILSYDSMKLKKNYLLSLITRKNLKDFLLCVYIKYDWEAFADFLVLVLMQRPGLFERFIEAIRIPETHLEELNNELTLRARELGEDLEGKKKKKSYLTQAKEEIYPKTRPKFIIGLYIISFSSYIIGIIMMIFWFIYVSMIYGGSLSSWVFIQESWGLLYGAPFAIVGIISSYILKGYNYFRDILLLIFGIILLFISLLYIISQIFIFLVSEFLV